MAKSKSFKSLGDLKDFDLFKPETPFSSKQINQKKIAQEPKSQIESGTLPAQSSVITQPAVESVSGTKDQEASYQARLEWINKQEQDLSLLEIDFSRIKKTLNDERHELSIQRFSIESDKKTHEKRLSKLDDLEEFERKLSLRESSIELQDSAVKKKAEELSALKTKLQKEMHSLETQLKRALSETVSASLKIESRDKKINALKKDVDAGLILKKNSEIKLLELKKELAASTKTINELYEQIARFEAPHNIKLDIWEFVEFITKKGAKPVELGYENNKIAICGDAPWKKNDFIEFLKSKGFSPTKSISPDVEIAVVGRDFDSEELEGQLVVRQGKKIHFYSQELLIASIASGINPLANPRTYKDLLEKFSKDHPGLLFLQDGFEFPWPLPNISDSVALEFKHDGSVKESPLVRVGYHVGRENGRSQAVRQKILENSFYGAYDDSDKWYVESDEYMKRWGRPRSRTRLFQMSHHIHALITARRKLPSMSQAVEEWEDDLRWLKKFYKPHMSFKWPVLK
jgi:hypothetical protein